MNPKYIFQLVVNTKNLTLQLGITIIVTHTNITKIETENPFSCFILLSYNRNDFIVAFGGIQEGGGMEGNGVDTDDDYVLVIQEGSGMEGNGVDTDDDHVFVIQEENIMDGIISLPVRMTSNHVLVSSIASKLNKVPRQNFQECCIHRVPPVFLNGNEEAYTPQMVSIGPFHRGCKNLKAMELHKLRYLNDFLNRRPEMRLEQFIDSLTGLEERARLLEQFIDNLRGLEERARLCYGEPIDLTSDEFVEMMLIDGCFILELFLHPRGDMLTTKLMFNMLLEEITDLLENQLPFFILEHLFYLVYPGNLSFLRLSVSFVRHKHGDHSVDELSQSIHNQEVKHFVDLQRKFCVPTSPTRIPPGTDYKLKFIPSATELHASGVKFTKDKRPCFLDITFTKNGVFNIPSIIISDNTNRGFRNLIVFELLDQQAGYGSDYLGNYAIVMDCLINTPDDVALLRRYGIIENWVGEDQEVSRLFNTISKWVMTSPNTFYYATLCEDVNIYYQKRRHKWRATLTSDYFGTPWSIMSFLAACVLLVCTFLQTLYDVKKP